jgi:hypothetical protein
MASAAATGPSVRLEVGIGTGGGSIRSSLPGIDCGLICGASFARGTKVILIAQPYSRFTFQRWAGGCSGPALRCMVSMNQATNAIAVFTPKPGEEITTETPILNVAVAGGGRITSSPSGIDCSRDDLPCFTALALGTQVTLSAAPARGYAFAGWGGPPGVARLCGKHPHCTVTLNFSTSIEAAFRNK